MKLESEIYSYLEGKKFSNALPVKLSARKDLSLTRIETLENLSRNKNIIHVGFADHIPLIEYKISTNQWLHKRLLNAAATCVGIDIDQEAVTFVRERLKISDVHVLDLVNDEIPEYLERDWDLIIVGEVLEHIDDTVAYLKAIRKKYKGRVAQMIVTVPNAFALQNIICSLKGLELINSDHRFWFTPYTLAKVATSAGFSVDDFSLCQYYEGGKWWRSKLIRRYPLLSDNLVMVLNF